MIIEIEVPEEFEDYKEDIIKYAIEAIKIKKLEDEIKIFEANKKEEINTSIDKIKIDGEKYKKPKKQIIKD